MCLPPSGCTERKARRRTATSADSGVRSILFGPRAIDVRCAPFCPAPQTVATAARAPSLA
eukprot:CAMPEP_0176222962 /NCGR_PEP_ID=MMETSP0121_2-20121125/20502_1 /TAXON_ID=160619 /ORGANISM="Kryptoperidinium foliaceum, Strain CCMP 1326" /LENGTH=59 /DNA_ID=CAMNT_0017562187 /DNA_START=46 /DNA_END=222 /DNA_ORIENTATION=-